MIFGEKERRKADVLLCVPFSPSSFSEHTNERVGKNSSIWVQPKASGVFPLLSGGFRELQEVSFLPEAPVKLFSTHFSRLNMNKKKN